MSTAPDLVILGNLIVDDLLFEDGTTRMAQAGGAVLHAALAASLWGVSVGIVSPVGDDYPRETLELLRSRGVMLDGLVPLHGPGLRAWIQYESTGRQIIHREGSPSHHKASPMFEHVPTAWLGARAFHLAPMQGIQQIVLTRQMRIRCGQATFISVDPVLRLTTLTPRRWGAILDVADAFFPSDDEWCLSEDGSEVREALNSYTDGRRRHVLHKRGARGGTLHRSQGVDIHWSARAETIIDPTGAGDAFAMGFVTAMLAGVDVKQALERARVSASFALEGWGSEGLANATPAAAQARLATWAAQESTK